MSNRRWNSKIDWKRFEVQEGLRPAENNFEAADREAIKNLSPELQAERINIVDKFVRVMQVYKTLGEGLANTITRDSLIKEIRNGN